jgi:citrate lyase alpha subunit
MGSGVVMNGANFFLIIGWFWVTYKSPKLVQQFAMQTGIGGAAAGVAQQVGRMAIQSFM